MAPSRIQPKQASLAATGIACLVGAVACILIGSIYVGKTSGWMQFALSVFSAAMVCTVGLSVLAYAAHQQYMVKRNLFSDHDNVAQDFDYQSTGQWAVVTGATDGIGKEYARQVSNNSSTNNCRSRGDIIANDDDVVVDT